MTAINGNTYPVRAAIKALGGVWDKEKRAWMVPDEKAAEARKLVSTPASAMARESGFAYYTRALDGWAVCVPAALVGPGDSGEAIAAAGAAMVGKSIDVRTKAGRINSETLGRFLGRRPEGYVFQTIRSNEGEYRRAAYAQMRDPGEDSADRWSEGRGE